MRPRVDYPETVAHLRQMAVRYRQLALATWDKDVLKILDDMSHGCDDEARVIEGEEAKDAIGTVRER